MQSQTESLIEDFFQMTKSVQFGIESSNKKTGEAKFTIRKAI